jgi:hypothetical protein
MDAIQFIKQEHTKAKAAFAKLLEATPANRQTPEALRAHQKAEADKWWPVIKAAGVKPEG